MKLSYLIILVSALNFVSLDLNAHMDLENFLTLEDAKQIANAAHAHAQQENWNVAIVIIDAGGHLIYFLKMDETMLASNEIAIQKAKTALFYKRPSKVFQDRIADGGSAILSLPDMLAFEGGIPIERDGNIIGAIGVSGVTPQQDGIIAAAGLEGF
ncbi:MAG: GlcG/HbpS family heme-binding protein [bacterium]